jgi:hypothetical protein
VRGSAVKGRKVFGIGFQRTGTLSLNEALNLLGIRSRHNAQELFENPNHPVLDAFDGFTDNPIPLLYRQLDQRFPGSRFILTDRDLDSWLKSVKWLFADRRARWDRKPVVDRIHVALYGTTRFDEPVFRERFLRHRDEVLDHFKDRSDDLLVMDFGRGDGWSELCAFLGTEIPSLDFPHKHKTVRGARRIMRRLRRSELIVRARKSLG